MNLSRRGLLKAAVGMPAAAWLLNYRALAAPFTGQVKITKIKTMGLDNVADGCLIRIETDAGIIGYGEAGLPSAAARARVDMMAPQLIGQDPLAIERHFLGKGPVAIGVHFGQQGGENRDARREIHLRLHAILLHGDQGGLQVFIEPVRGGGRRGQHHQRDGGEPDGHLAVSFRP